MQRLKPIIHQVPQRSEEWHKLRLGKVTGSNCKKIYYNITDTDRNAAIRLILGIDRISAQVKTTTEYYELWEMNPIALLDKAGMAIPETVERKNYRENLVGERLTGIPSDPEPYVSHDMKWGMINEDLARTLYQLQNRCSVEDGPFMEHPELKAGVSPDGISTDMSTGEIGLLEIKCLRTANHLFKIIKTQEVPEEFYDQIQMQMWVAGYDWCDFVAYDSRLPEGLKLFIKRVDYDEKYINDKLEPAVRKFLDECDNDFKHFWASVKEK